jgi:hypothetical protein
VDPIIIPGKLNNSHKAPLLGRIQFVMEPPFQPLCNPASVMNAPSTLPNSHCFLNVSLAFCPSPSYSKITGLEKQTSTLAKGFLSSGSQCMCFTSLHTKICHFSFVMKIKKQIN